MFLHVESVKKGEFEAPKYGFPMGAAFKDFETLQGAFTNEGVRATGEEVGGFLFMKSTSKEPMLTKLRGFGVQMFMKEGHYAALLRSPSLRT